MADKKFCDKCGSEIVKLPNIVLTSGRKAELCNDCWNNFVRIMGYPFGGYPFGSSQPKKGNKNG